MDRQKTEYEACWAPLHLPQAAHSTGESEKWSARGGVRLSPPKRGLGKGLGWWFCKRAV